MFSVRFWKKGDVLVVNKFFFEWRFERDGRSQEVGLIQPQQCPPSGRIFMPREDRTSGGPSAVAFEPDHVNMLSTYTPRGARWIQTPKNVEIAVGMALLANRAVVTVNLLSPLSRVVAVVKTANRPICVVVIGNRPPLEIEDTAVAHNHSPISYSWSGS